MNVQDCINFANENKICFLATAEENQPRVRALSFWFADETGFYFQTGSIKSFCQQLKENPKTEVCFFKREDSWASTLRISGEAEFLEATELKQRAIDDRPFLKNFGFTAESPNLIIFRIKHGNAHFWTIEKNLQPKEIIYF